MWSDMIALPILALAAPATPITAVTAEECTAATAHAMTISEIIAMSAHLPRSHRHGPCITVTGVVWRHWLYADVADIYRAAGPDPARAQVIGYRHSSSPVAYADDPIFEPKRMDGFSEPPRRVSVTGIIRGCSGGLLATGYADPACPWRTSLAIRRIEVSIMPGPVTRIVAADASPDVVTLSPLAADSVWTPRFAAAADELEAALRSRDASHWAPLLGVPWVIGDERERVAALLAAPQGAFRRALDSDRPTRRVILGWRTLKTVTAADRAGSEASKQAEAMVCWSSHPDADSLWPIAAMDADNRPDRPYACARITYSLYDPEPSWRAFVGQHALGLPEPDR